jgi:hypothetical protein
MELHCSNLDNDPEVHSLTGIRSMFATIQWARIGHLFSHILRIDGEIRCQREVGTSGG